MVRIETEKTEIFKSMTTLLYPPPLYNYNSQHSSQFFFFGIWYKYKHSHVTIAIIIMVYKSVVKLLVYAVNTDSAQRSSNKCKKYLPKNYS